MHSPIAPQHLGAHRRMTSPPSLVLASPGQGDDLQDEAGRAQRVHCYEPDADGKRLLPEHRHARVASVGGRVAPSPLRSPLFVYPPASNTLKDHWQPTQDRSGTPIPGPGRLLSPAPASTAAPCGCAALMSQLRDLQAKYRLLLTPDGDLRAALTRRDPSEHLELLLEFLTVSRSFQQAHPSPTSLGRHLTLQNVPSDLTLPQLHISSCLEEGSDAAGFSTLNGYTVVGEAGRGQYGVVKIATTAAGEFRAIKVVRKERLRRCRTAATASSTPAFSLHALGGPRRDSVVDAEVSRELNLMKRLRHRNIVPLYEVIDDPNEDRLYLVMPFIERGPLLFVSASGTCEPLDIDVCRGYLRQLLEAVLYLHQRRIVHLDIKPDNILLGGDGRVYLSDFGVSQMLRTDEDAIDEVTGTPAFTAPECFEDDSSISPRAVDVDHTDPTDRRPRLGGKALDVYALGVTFYLMALGHLPFNGLTYRELVTAVLTAPLEFPSLSTFSRSQRADFADAFDLMGRMLSRDPAMRITLGACHRHPFFRRTASDASTDSSAETISLPKLAANSDCPSHDESSSRHAVPAPECPSGCNQRLKSQSDDERLDPAGRSCTHSFNSAPPSV